MTEAAPITVRVPLGYDLLMGVSQTLRAPLHRGAELVVATTATCTVTNGAGVVLAIAAATTIVAGVPTQAIVPADLDGQVYGDDWQVRWDVTTEDGEQLVSVHEAALVRSRLQPVITSADLFQLHRSLNGALGAGAAVTTRVDWQDAIDAAWVDIVGRLRQSGRRASLILSPADLREAHLYAALEVVYADLASTDPQGAQYWPISQAYGAKFRDAWGRVKFKYDDTLDGRGNLKRKSASAAMWLCGR
jgi:hypothetical protein